MRKPLSFLADRRMTEAMLEVAAHPNSSECLAAATATAHALQLLPFSIDIWQAQNIYYAMAASLTQNSSQQNSMHRIPDPDRFKALGRALAIAVNQPRGRLKKSFFPRAMHIFSSHLGFALPGTVCPGNPQEYPGIPVERTKRRAINASGKKETMQNKSKLFTLSGVAATFVLGGALAVAQNSYSHDHDRDHDAYGQRHHHHDDDRNGSPAEQQGYAAGEAQGRSDHDHRHSFRPTKVDTYKNVPRSPSGYNRDQFKNEYRQAFVKGYSEGYGRH